MTNAASTPATPVPDRFGRWGEPNFTIVYGISGIGKTTDMIYSFPTALFIAMPGALKPSIATCGWRVTAFPANTIEEATQIIMTAIKAGGQYSAVVIDDLSLLAENTAQMLLGKAKGYDYWRMIAQSIITLKTLCRNAGFHVVCNAHSTAGHMSDGDFIIGGPTMPTKNLTKAIPHIADTVLRVGQDANRKPWKGLYHCDSGNPLWHEKDRLGAFRANSPMNLAEGMRDAGYPIPRAPGLEWQEPTAEDIAQKLDKGGDFKAIWEELMRKGVEKGVDPLHLRWALRDGRDRYEFRKGRQASLMTL